jgi:16S rRNA (cytosine967-C5)-methyltransferase
VTFARLNTLRGTPEELAHIWEKEGIRFVPRQFDWVKGDLVFELKSHPPLTKLSSFLQGWFYIQDPSTLLAPGLLAAEPAQRILDLCAAPGGKTTYLAQIMQNKGAITAYDPHISRREMIRRNCDRLGIQNVQVVESLPGLPAAAASPPGRSELYDHVLIDAPCSNTGVMRRRVDLRWRVQPEELLRLRQTQRQLLDAAKAHLRPGGHLVYSTCSLEPEENRSLIEEFLAENKSFDLLAERELLPFSEGVDGAYVALLVCPGS